MNDDPEEERWEVVLAQAEADALRERIKALEDIAREQSRRLSGFMTREAVIDARAMCVAEVVARAKMDLRRLAEPEPRS